MAEFIGAIFTCVGLTFVGLLFISFIYDAWFNCDKSLKMVDKVIITLASGLIAAALLFSAVAILLLVASVSI